MAKVHIHDWYLNGEWHCKIPLTHDPGDLDAYTAWWVLGIIRNHMQLDQLGTCECGWIGTDYEEHLDVVVLYALRDIEPKI